MSHTFKGEKTTFIFNPDLSGSITVIDNETRESLEISGDDLESLLIEYNLLKGDWERSPYEDPYDE